MILPRNAELEIKFINYKYLIHYLDTCEN